MANDQIFAIGGVTGEEDPVTFALTTCTDRVYVASLPLVMGDDVWSRTANLSTARRSHAACVVKDDN